MLSRGSDDCENSCVIGKRRLYARHSCEIPFCILLLYLTHICPPTHRAVYWTRRSGFRGWSRSGADEGRKKSPGDSLLSFREIDDAILYTHASRHTITIWYQTTCRATSTVAVTSERCARAGKFRRLLECKFFGGGGGGGPVELRTRGFETRSAIVIYVTLLL